MPGDNTLLKDIHVSIEVDDSDLDRAIGKANRLKELLEEVTRLSDSLSAGQKSEPKLHSEGNVSALEKKQVYLAVVKHYTHSDPEIVVFRKPAHPGRRISFDRAHGDRFYGEVLACIPTEDGGELHQWINAATGSCVRIDPRIIGPSKGK